MRVVADSHALVFYLFTPARLSELALEALLEAEDTDGIAVSVATLADLWYASQKTGSPAVAPGVYEQIQATVLDPATNLVLQPISAATIARFGTVPLPALRDPFGRFILATAVQLRAPRSLPTVPAALPMRSRSSGEMSGTERVLWERDRYRMRAADGEREPSGSAGAVRTRRGMMPESRSRRRERSRSPTGGPRVRCRT